MKKRILSLLCVLTLLAGALPSAAALQGESSRAADSLATLGLLKAGASGDYGLDAPATRAQAAVLLVNMAGAEITYAAHQGWAAGAAPAEFRPDSPVTANAWFAFLLRMLGYSDRSGDFTVSDAAVFARQIGLAARTYNGTLTRGQLYQSAADALTFSYKDGSATVIGRLVERVPSTRAAANALGLLDTVLTARQVADRLTSAVLRMCFYEKEKQVEENTPSTCFSFS